jgi:hypothetical protein
MNLVLLVYHRTSKDNIGDGDNKKKGRRGEKKPPAVRT